MWVTEPWLLESFYADHLAQNNFRPRWSRGIEGWLTYLKHQILAYVTYKSPHSAVTPSVWAVKQWACNSYSLPPAPLPWKVSAIYMGSGLDSPHFALHHPYCSELIADNCYLPKLCCSLPPAPNALKNIVACIILGQMVQHLRIARPDTFSTWYSLSLWQPSAPMYWSTSREPTTKL